MLLTFHHIAIDGASLETVAGELARLYSAAAGGTAAEEQPEPVQYADFARREQAAADRLEQGLSHWAAPPRRRLPAPSAPPRAPARRHRQPPGRQPHRSAGPAGAGRPARTGPAAPGHPVHRGARRLLRRPAPLHRRGRPGHRLSPAPTARARTCAVWSDCASTPSRSGWTSAGDPAFATLVERVRDALLDAQQHRDVPFDLILERLGAGARGADGTALIRVTADVLREPTALPAAGHGRRAGRRRARRGEVRPVVRPGGLRRPRRASSSTARSALDDAAASRLARRLRRPAVRGRGRSGPAALTAAGASSRRSWRDGCHPAEARAAGAPRVADAAVPVPAAGPLLAYAVLRGDGWPLPRAAALPSCAPALAAGERSRRGDAAGRPAAHRRRLARPGPAARRARGPRPARGRAPTP